MATLLLLTNDMRSSAEIPLLQQPSPPRQSRPGRSHRAAGCTGRGCDLARCPTGSGSPVLCGSSRPRKRRRCSSSPAKAGWPHCRPTGASTTCCSRPRACRGGRTGSGWHDAVGRNQCRPGYPVWQHHDRRGRLQRQAQWCPARSHLHRVRAIEVPRTAPGTTCSAASSC